MIDMDTLHTQGPIRVYRHIKQVSDESYIQIELLKKLSMLSNQKCKFDLIINSIHILKYLLYEDMFWYILISNSDSVWTRLCSLIFIPFTTKDYMINIAYFVTQIVGRIPFFVYDDEDRQHVQISSCRWLQF